MGNLSRKKRNRRHRDQFFARRSYNGASMQLDRIPSGSCTSLWRASSRKTGAASRDARQQVRNWYRCQVAGRLVPRVSYGTRNGSPARVSCRAPGWSSLLYESINKFLVTLLLSLNELRVREAEDVGSRTRVACSPTNGCCVPFAFKLRVDQVRGTLFPSLRGKYGNRQVQRDTKICLSLEKKFQTISMFLFRDFHTSCVQIRGTRNPLR